MCYTLQDVQYMFDANYNRNDAAQNFKMIMTFIGVRQARFNYYSEKIVLCHRYQDNLFQICF